MNACPKCGAPLGDKNIICPKCRNIKGTPSCLSTCVVVGILLAIFGSNIHITTTGGMLGANMAAVSARGKDVYVAITSANVEREPLGLPSIWPTTYLAATNQSGDISSKVFATSSEYFYELYDGPNVGTINHDPYVKGFDYSKLAGAGVPAKAGPGLLTATNNMWVIAANITEGDVDRIPVMITRNVNIKEIERVVNQGLKKEEFKTRITFSEIYKAPFSNKGLVAVRKDGQTRRITKSRKSTLGELFENKELPARDPSKSPIVYLMP